MAPEYPSMRNASGEALATWGRERRRRDERGAMDVKAIDLTRDDQRDTTTKGDFHE